MVVYGRGIPMKRIALILLPGLLLASSASSFFNHPVLQTEAWKKPAPVYSSSLPTSIKLNDTAESQIRTYYDSLNLLADSERTGDNLLKNLKPILQNFTYYSYDNVWKIYEITDREWSLSPASEDTYGEYNASSNSYAKYVYSSKASGDKNNPYVHTLYRNRDENGVTVESGRIREWGDHTATGTNREHVWCQSRGFKADSGAEGPAGTDVHHLISGDGYVNQTPHNNNPYGYVDPANVTIDAGTTRAFAKGNKAGKPLHPHDNDQSVTVFEPQDSDKGDIARACFYMVACYNNLSGEGGITRYNPNLTLVDYATDSGAAESSSDTHPVAMGILSDLLEWHRLDPVDEYEIHRNNLIYENYQHNRNPFIDFPEWVDLIWGESKGTKSASPAKDALYGEGGDTPSASTPSTSTPGASSATPTPEPAEQKSIPWNIVIPVAIGAVVVLIILIIIFANLSKKQKKAVKKAAEKAIRSTTKKSSSSSKKKK